MTLPVGQSAAALPRSPGDQQDQARSSFGLHGYRFATFNGLDRYLRRHGVDVDRFLRKNDRAVAVFELKPLRWGGTRFFTQRGISRWLGARNVAYSSWASRNPAAVAILQGNGNGRGGDKPPPGKDKGGGGGSGGGGSGGGGSVVTPPPATAPAEIGVAIGGNEHNLSQAEIDRDFAGYSDAQARWFRFDVNWAVIQAGGPGSYNWDPFDRIIRGALARGLKVLVTLQYTPAWARGPGTHEGYPPSNLDDYARFAADAARRYGPLGVRHWEIWNEPNIERFWGSGPDPARYAAMVTKASASIKAVDPGAFVLAGSLSPYGRYNQMTADRMNPVNFLERMYAAGARGSFDALSHHPYNYPWGLDFFDWSAWSQLESTTPSLRSLMVANGDGGKQIWATEFGFPTGASDRAVSPTAQADLLTSAVGQWRRFPWAGPLFWYSFRDLGTNRLDVEDNFGVVQHDWSPKPALAAFRAASSG